MILTLAEYDYTKFGIIKKECDLIDFIILQSFKKFDSYCEKEYHKRSMK